MHCHYISKYRGAAYDTCNLKYSVPKEIPVVFHNKSNYDYHFIKRNKKRVLRGKFNCLKENTEKHKTFSVPITKRAKRIGRNREETTKTWSYKLPFTDSTRYKLIKTRCWNVFENVCLIWLPLHYVSWGLPNHQMVYIVLFYICFIPKTKQANSYKQYRENNILSLFKNFSVNLFMWRHFEKSSSHLFNKLAKLALTTSNFSHKHKSFFHSINIWMCFHSH